LLLRKQNAHAFYCVTVRHHGGRKEMVGAASFRSLVYKWKAGPSLYSGSPAFSCHEIRDVPTSGRPECGFVRVCYSALCFSDGRNL